MLYNAHDPYEINSCLLALRETPKPNAAENACTVHMEGNRSLLCEPFFGTGAVQNFSQPKGIVTKTFSKQDLLHRILFSFELQDLVDHMTKPPEFWDACYSSEVLC